MYNNIKVKRGGVEVHKETSCTTKEEIRSWRLIRSKRTITEVPGRGSKESTTRRAMDQSNKMFICVVKYLYCVFIGIF